MYASIAAAVCRDGDESNLATSDVDVYVLTVSDRTREMLKEKGIRYTKRFIPYVTCALKKMGALSLRTRILTRASLSISYVTCAGVLKTQKRKLPLSTHTHSCLSVDTCVSSDGFCVLIVLLVRGRGTECFTSSRFSLRVIVLTVDCVA
jgi:hypothetical protein